MALRHVEIFTTFAGPGGEDAIEEIYGWDPVTSTDHRYLKIDEEITMEDNDYYNERMSWWESYEPYDF